MQSCWPAGSIDAGSDAASPGQHHFSTPFTAAAGRECPYAILLAFSGMRAALAAGSAFNDRVAECHAAAAQLLQRLGRADAPRLLGEVSHTQYLELKAELGESLVLLHLARSTCRLVGAPPTQLLQHPGHSGNRHLRGEMSHTGWQPHQSRRWRDLGMFACKPCLAVDAGASLLSCDHRPVCLHSSGALGVLTQES